VYAHASDTVSGFKQIIDGELDDIPENFFLYKASIKEVKEAFEASKKEEK
jgi:F0F1-type ATP synthase beta subunit